MKCEHCGGDIPYRGRICPNCGKDCIPKNEFIETEIYNVSKDFHEKDYQITKVNSYTTASVIFGVFAILFTIVGHYHDLFFYIALITTLLTLVLFIMGKEKPGKSTPIGLILSILALVGGYFNWQEMNKKELPFIVGTWKNTMNAKYIFNEDDTYEYQNVDKNEFQKGTYHMIYDRSKDLYRIDIRLDEVLMSGIPIDEEKTKTFTIEKQDDENEVKASSTGQVEHWRKTTKK